MAICIFHPTRLTLLASARSLNAVLRELTGVAPVGYRSPSWEVTEETFSLLGEMGFEYDSSCMGDDRPYLETIGSTTLVELPVHWSLDDFPYYSWPEVQGGPLSDPAVVSAIWLSEFRVALAESGHVTYTAHPEVSGRRSRFEALKALVETMCSTADVWFATHKELAQLVRARTEPAPGPGKDGRPLTSLEAHRVTVKVLNSIVTARRASGMNARRAKGDRRDRTCED